MIAASKAYRDTGDEYYLNWLLKTIEYSKAHFADPEYGEWYGYLRRDGLPTMPSTKGSTFKGPFHVPRALSMTERTLTEIIGDEGGSVGLTTCGTARNRGAAQHPPCRVRARARNARGRERVHSTHCGARRQLSKQPARKGER